MNTHATPAIFARFAPRPEAPPPPKLFATARAPQDVLETVAFVSLLLAASAPAAVLAWMLAA